MKKLMKLSFAIGVMMLITFTSTAQQNDNAIGIIQSVNSDGKSGMLLNSETGKTTTFTTRGRNPINIGDRVKLIIVPTPQREKCPECEPCGVVVDVSHPCTYMEGHQGCFFWAVISETNTCLL